MAKEDFCIHLQQCFCSMGFAFVCRSAFGRLISFLTRHLLEDCLRDNVAQEDFFRYFTRETAYLTLNVTASHLLEDCLRENVAKEDFFHF